MRAGAASVLAALAIVVALALSGCGGGGEETAAPLTMHQLAASLEDRSAQFLQRQGTTLHRNLVRFLGGQIEAKVSRGTAECRPGRETASISDPEKYPFACVVEGGATGNGLTVNITLGFVGLKLDGSCWRAANERVSVTTGAPALIGAKEAHRPVNQLAACA